MKVLGAVIMFAVTLSVSGAEQRALLARFEVLAGAFRGPLTAREAVILYTRGTEIEHEKLGRDLPHPPLGVGSFKSMRLRERLKKIELPKLDYQRYFDDLAKKPPADGKQAWLGLDGQQVEVEMHINGVVVKFKMWNPDSFFYSYDGDKVVAAVGRALDAFILEFGRSVIYF